MNRLELETAANNNLDVKVNGNALLEILNQSEYYAKELYKPPFTVLQLMISNAVLDAKVVES